MQKFLVSTQQILFLLDTVYDIFDRFSFELRYDFVS